MSGLREGFDAIVADVPTYGDLDRAIARAERDRGRRNGVIAGIAAAAAVLVAIVGVQAVTRVGSRTPQPIGPVTTPTPTTTTTVDKPGLLRPGTFPVLPPNELNTWDDPQDTPVAGIDIRTVRNAELYNGLGQWEFRLAARTPRDPVGRVIAYGVVADANRDGKADCQLGISSDGTKTGDFYVWVTNLRTGKTEIQNRPPYGFPVEFIHPAETKTDGDDDRLMHFAFLGDRPEPGPCDRFGTESVYYVWSSVTQGGRVTARDYAPDAAWLPMKCYDC